MLILASMDGTELRSLVTGAASLAVILVALYRGGWRYVTHFTIMVIFSVVVFATFIVGVLTLIELWNVLFGPADTRAESLLAAARDAAGIIAVLLALGNERLMASLAKLTFIDRERD